VFERADLRDEDAVHRAAAGCSAILHQGAMRSVPRSVEQPEKTTDVNVRGTLNVLLAARDCGAAVVFASSSSVYGDQDRFPLREDMEPRPRSPYAASKLAGEGYCRAWWQSYGVPTVALRYFNVYGPGQDPENEYAAVVPRFVMACLDGKRPIVHADGEVIVADIIPPSAGMLPDIFSLLSSGARHGFFLAACAGLFRTFFSEYRKIREREGFSTYEETEFLELLSRRGFAATRLAANVGFNQQRMTFRARPRAH